MFKKLREKLYDIQTKKNLENIKFDYFAYYGDSPIPAFQTKQGKQCKGEICSVFFPKTEKSFILAFSKLKKYYFKKFSCSTIQEFVRDYSNYFNLDQKVYDDCMEIYKEKRGFVSKVEEINK